MSHSDRLGTLKETLESQHKFSQPASRDEQIANSEQLANTVQTLIDLHRSGGDVTEFLNSIA